MTKGLSAQKRAKSDFFAALETSLRIYGPARDMCRYDGDSFEESTYQPNVAAKVVGLAFLGAVAAWEDFLAEVYLGYLSGYAAPNGYAPELISGRAMNKSHARLLAAGESHPGTAERKMRWNNFRWVQALSKIHFKGGHPFHLVDEADVKWLELSVIIRNRIAHNSDQARRTFKNSVNRIFRLPENSPLPRGFSPGQLLIVFLEPYSELHRLRNDDHFWGDIFEGYISLWRRLGDQLCPD
jgi:hypothetical protein